MSLCPICENDYAKPSCGCGYVHPAFRNKSPYQTDDINFNDIDFWSGWQFGVGLFSGCVGVVFKFTLLLSLIGVAIKILFSFLGINDDF